MKPPTAKRIAHSHRLHGDTRPDDYFWLNQSQDPAVIEYLQEENGYWDSVFTPLRPLAERLYEEMLARVQEDKVEVAVEDGPYFYYARTEKGREYRIQARKRAASRAALEHAPEEIILDLNQAAEGSSFYSVTVLRISPDHTLLAYLENRDGTDRYTLRVKDLQTGKHLPDEIAGVFLYGSLEWDASGSFLFYTTVDETQRAHRLWRHAVGQTSADELLYEESDSTFSLTLGKSRSGRHLFLHSDSKVTSEVRYLPSARPTDAWMVLQPRKEGVEYDLEDWGDDFVILTNEGAPNFRLVARPITATPQAAWRPLIPYNQDIYLQSVHPYAGCLLLEGREEGFAQVWQLQGGQLRRLSWSDTVHSVGMGHNRMYETNKALVVYDSWLTPETVYELDLTTRETELLQRDEVPGGYDASAYVQEMIWAPADDGTKVPVSAVYRKGALDAGPAPLLLNGYGSYGYSIDPGFNPSRLTLLDRGVVFATAHIRGGAELGRPWYEDGKLLRKRNTFTDFVACAQELVRIGWTAPDRLAASGRSAGGLLMGAVVNLQPDLFRVVSAGVPFVDVMTTMLDPSIPLTTLEWDEWGDPRDPAYYEYMKSYSPYDNVEAKAYPNLYVFAGLNDPRVGYWEPAKWVARLRAMKTDQNEIILKTYMGAGHGGPSGRYARLREFSEEFAFLLHHLGIDD